MAEQAAVGGGGSVVEFVDHEVIEVFRRESFAVGALAERPHRGAEHGDLRVAGLAHLEADARPGADAREGFRGLAQKLLAVGDEQHAPGAHVFGEGLGLDRCRVRRRFGFLAARGDRARRRDAALLVGVDLVVAEREGTRVAEDLLEAGARFEEAVVAGVLDSDNYFGRLTTTILAGCP